MRGTVPIDDDRATFCHQDVIDIEVTVAERLPIRQAIQDRKRDLLRVKAIREIQLAARRRSIRLCRGDR